MSQESVIKAKEEAKRKKIEEEKVVAKPPIEKEEEIKAAWVEKKPAEVSVPLKRERKTGFGLFSFQRIKTSTLTSVIRIKLLPIISMKIGLLQLLKVKALSIAESPKIQLHRPSTTRAQTLEPINVMAFKASYPELHTSKAISIRTQLLKLVTAKIPSRTIQLKLSVPIPQRMRISSPRLFRVKITKLIQGPRLKSQPIVIPRSRILITEPVKVGTMPMISFGKAKVKLPVIPKPEVPEREVEEKIEVLDFSDLFLEFPLDKKRGGLGALLAANRPICIILCKPKDDSYVDAIGFICREIYRMKKGGKPTPRVLSSGRKDEIEEFLKAGERIFIIDDSKSEFFNTSKIGKVEDLNWDILRDRLRELFSQDFGFIIFYMEDKWVLNFMTHLIEVEHIIPSSFVIKPKELDAENKKQIAEISWGFADTEIKEGSFDQFFCIAERSFYEKLSEISKDKWLMHCVKPHKNGEESPEHRLIKAMVVKIIAKEMDLKRKNIPEKILTEYSISKDVRPDIYVPLYKKNKPLSVEVETLYETGFRPVDKIDHETLRKYVDAGLKIPIWIVMMNLPTLMYTSEIKELRRIYKDEYDLDVQFYAIDVESERLVSIDEMGRQLIELR